MGTKTLALRLAAALGMLAGTGIGAWEALPTGTTASLRHIQFIGNDTGYVFGDAGVILMTVDGGTAWTKPPFSPALTANLGPAHFVDGNTGWLVVGEDSLYRTTDGGASWVFMYQAAGKIEALGFASKTAGFMVTRKPNSQNPFYDSVHVSRSTDSGSTWATFRGGTAGSASSQLEFRASIQFSGTGHGLIIGGGTTYYEVSTGLGTNPFGWLLRTFNAGTTWSDSSTEHAWKAAAFSGDNTPWLLSSFKRQIPGCGFLECPPQSYYQTNIAQGEKDGNTWNMGVQRNLPAILNAASFIDSGTGIAVGNSGWTLWTRDGGVTWTSEAITTYSLQGISVVSPSSAFAIGDHGTLLKANPAELVGIRQMKTDAMTTRLRVSANVLMYDLPYVADVSIRLTDASGKVIWEFLRSSPPGTYSMALPVERLGTGRYFIKFRAGGIQQSLNLTRP